MSNFRYQSMYLSQGNAVVTWQMNQLENTSIAPLNTSTDRNVAHIDIK